MNSLLNRLLHSHMEHRRWLAGFLCLAILVSIGTVAAVSYTGVAMTYTERLLECPYALEGAQPVAHVHNDDCRDETGRLVCTLPEREAHEHTDECYEEKRTLTCTLEETDGHVHTPECYRQEILIVCGMEESDGHTHSENCWSEQSEYICGQEENQGHIHDESCYTEEQVLVCGTDDEAHEHTEECYQTKETLTCGQQEGDGAHSHTAECIHTQLVLTCGLEEGAGAHHHTDECREVQEILICGLKEGEGAHHHGENCYSSEKVLICGEEELPVHVHGESCFRTVEKTAAEEPEAEKTNAEETESKDTAQDSETPESGGEDQNSENEQKEPESDSKGKNPPSQTEDEEEEERELPERPVGDLSADLESPEIWEKAFEDLKLSGDWAKDLITVAETQFGYRESSRNFDAVLNDAKDDYILKGWTRFGAWYGIPYGDWCAMFISFCLHYAEIPETAFPYDCGTITWVNSLTEREMYQAVSRYTPKAGDLVFFDWEGDGKADHVGLVYQVDLEESMLTAIEGNHTDCVETFEYYLNDAHLMGYGILPENPEFDEKANVESEQLESGETAHDQPEKTSDATENAAETETDEEIMPIIFKQECGGILVTVEASPDAFPEGTVMALVPVNGNMLQNTVSEAVEKEILEIQAVDISFVAPDGTKVEPAVPIRVSMTAADGRFAEESPQVVHVDNAGKAEVVEQADDIERTAREVVFDADAFSIYAIVYAVDFEYSVNGKMYQFSLPGGEKIALSDLIEVLGIIGDTNNGEKAAFNSVDSFLKEVADVKFSDESLVKVTQNEEGNDWTLESLAPFDTEESLTITMKNGDVVTVKVTDAQMITDLSQILDSTNGVTVIGANKVGDAYQVKENQPYEIQLHFLETNDKQIDFTQDGSGNYPTMTYQLPAGLRMESHNGAIEGDGFTLAYTIDANGLMTVNWVVNDADKFRRTVESNEVDIKLNIKASFKTNDDKFEFAGGATLDVDVDGTRDLDITKTGRYDTNDKKMHYSVTVTSTGVNDGVVVTDKLSDTTGAVIYAKDVHATNGQTYPTTNNNDGFVVNVGRMLDGESIKFEYTADVNLEKLDVDANGKGGSVEQTGNTVKVKSTQVPEEKQKDWSLDHQIQVSSTNKGNATAGEIVDGKRTMNWHIDVNREQNISVKGKTIKDKITGGEDKMSYSGDGIYVTKHWKDSNGIQHSSGPELVSWDSLSQYSNTGANKGWTFTPNDDGNYWYEIDYTTVVDVDDSLTDITVKNHVDGPYGSSDGSGTAKQEDTKRLDFDKSVDSFDLTAGTVTWKVTISVPPQGLNKAVVEDYYPTQSVTGITDRRGQDVLLEGSTISVSGTDSEKDKYTTENIMKNPYYNGGEEVKAGFRVTFTKYDASSGTWVPGLTGTGEKHDVTITVTTKMDQEWLDAAKASMNTNDFRHTNNAKLTYDGDATLDDDATVTVNPEETRMVKSVKDNKRLPTSDTNLLLSDGTKVPCWVYYIDLYGISDASFMDADGDETDIVITDTYEGDYLNLLDDSQIDSTLTCYDNNLYKDNCKLLPDVTGHNSYSDEKAIKAAVPSQQTRGQIVFRISKEDIPKNEHGEYYRHYRLSYTLYTPTAEDLEALKEAAAHDEGGIHVMPNTARWDKTPDSSAEVEYKEQTVTKNASNAHFNTNTATYDIDYTITVNPNGEKIGDDDYIKVTDTYENLTVNYATITWEPADAIVNYDRNGDQLIFRVKNETPVTIRYTASARVDGHYENTVDVHGQKVKTDGEADISSHGSVTSTDYKITILKHEKGNMTRVLEGAKFSLYRTGDTAESEGVLVKEGLITNENGEIVIDQIPKTWVDQTDPDYGKLVDLESNVYYYVKETEAPTGPYGQYQLKTSKYFFKIVKGESPDYTAEGGWKYLNNDVLAINNSYPEEESITLKVEKAWVGADDANLPDSINVTLYRKADQYSSAKELVGTYEVKKADGWKLTVPNLPTGYAYVVEEQPMDGYEVEYTDNNTFGVTRSDTIGITNTRKKLEIVKTWQDGEGSLQGIDVIVKKDGQEYQRVTLLKSDGWKTSLYGLPEGEYTVEEIVPAGKELVSITYTDADGKAVDSLPGVGTATITNKDKTPEPNTTSLSVQKKWVQADGVTEMTAEDLSYEKAKDLTATVELVRYKKQNTTTNVEFWHVKDEKWTKCGEIVIPQAAGVKFSFVASATSAGGLGYVTDKTKLSGNDWAVSGYTQAEGFGPADGNKRTVTLDTTGLDNVYFIYQYNGVPEISDLKLEDGGQSNSTSGGESPILDDSFTPVEGVLTYNNGWHYTFPDLKVSEMTPDGSFSYTYGIREVSCSDGFEFVSYDTLAVNEDDTNEHKVSVAAENGGTVQVVNKKTDQNGSLQLTKLVTVNNQSTDTTLADGTYTFTIHSVADGETTTNDKTVTITVTDGVAVSATGGTFDQETKYVTVSDLAEGDYTITETEVSGMTTTVSGGKDSVENETSNIVTVTVTAGGALTTDQSVSVTVTAGRKTESELLDTAKADFVNNIETRDIRVVKVWKDAGGTVMSSPPSGGTVSVQLYKEGVPTDQTITLDGTTDENGETGAWIGTFTVPKDGALYTVAETNVTPSNYSLVDVDITENTASGQSTRVIYTLADSFELNKTYIISSGDYILANSDGTNDLEARAVDTNYSFEGMAFLRLIGLDLPAERWNVKKAKNNNGFVVETAFGSYYLMYYQRQGKWMLNTSDNYYISYSNNGISYQANNGTHYLSFADGTVQDVSANPGNIQIYKRNDVYADGNIIYTITNKAAESEPTETAIQIKKVDKNTGTALQGALFSLTQIDENGHIVTDGITLGPLEVETDGTLSFSGLIEGRYRLEETQCPRGYVKISDDPIFAVQRDGSGNLTVSCENNEAGMIEYINGIYHVKNTPGVELPNTGGRGIGAYVGFGTLLSSCSLAILIFRRKRKAA